MGVWRGIKSGLWQNDIIRLMVWTILRPLVQFGSLKACLRVDGFETFMVERLRMVFFLVIPRMNLVVIRGAGVMT